MEERAEKISKVMQQENGANNAMKLIENRFVS